MQVTQTQVERVAEAARAQGRLGLDTEFMPEGRYRPLLCLVQIVVGEEVVILDALERRLSERERLGWAREECVVIAEATDERDPDEVWRRLPRVSSLDARERAVAQAVAGWRERTAAREDRPVGSVLRDPTVVEL